jgi:hypothetical protein
LIWLVIASTYAFGITCVLIVKYFKDARADELSRRIASVSLAELGPIEQIEAVSHIVDIRQKLSPWYEKSLSALGVFAFFSMTIAAGVQTIKSGIESAQVEQLRKEVSALQADRASLDASIEDISRSITASYRELGHVDPAGKKLLAHRVEYLLSKEPKTRDDIIEIFDTALLLQDFETATSALHANIKLLDETNPSDIISLAEFEYIEDAPNTSKEYLNRVLSKTPSLPVPWQIRIVVLQTLLAGDRDAGVKELSAILKISREEAERRLDSDTSKLKNANLTRNGTANGRRP